MPTIRLRRRASQARLQPVRTPATLAFEQALPWLLLSLVLTMFALVGQVPTWSLMVFGACTLWRYILARRHAALPSMVVRLLVFIPVATAVIMRFGTNPGAAGMLTFLVALLSLKILELRSARDFTIAALLGYFMVLSGFFYEQTLGLSIYLCAILLLNTVALIRCHSGGWRDARPSIKLALGLSAQAVPLVVLLFIVFPRVQGTFLRRIGGASTGLTGMSERLQPGSFSSLAQSDAPVFRAQITGGANVPQSELYWRGIVLDICETSMSWRARVQSPLTNGGAPPPRLGSRRVNQKITLFAQGKNWLFALDRPVGLDAKSAALGQLYTSDVLQSRQPLFSTVIYNAISETAAPDGELPPARRAAYLYLPPDLSDRAKNLAHGWRPAGRSDADVIGAAKAYFRGGGFTYTLNPGLLPDEGAMDAFLFKLRRGFCEHYAAALCTLMRAAGLPARVVVGYQGGELNDLWGGYYLIRQSDAHAWVEVWVDNRHWERVDPTAVVAPDRVSLGAENFAALADAGGFGDDARLTRGARWSWRWMVHHTVLAWDGLDQQWNFFVLGYDQDKQQSALEGLGVANLSWLASTALVMAAVFGILIVGTGAMRAFNRGTPGPKDPARTLYDRFCRRLAVLNVRRAATEGPLDYARRASVVLPDQAAAIRGITDLYVATRYAPPAVRGRGEHGSLAALRDAVKKFRPARPPV